MRIDPAEVVNVAAAAMLLFVVFKNKKDATTQFLALFAYGALHFSYAVFAVGVDDSKHVLAQLHLRGSGLLASLSGFVLLGVVYFQLMKNACGLYLLHRDRYKRIVLCFGGVMAAVFLGYLLSLRTGDWLQFKNIVSIEVMLLSVLIGAVLFLDAPFDGSRFNSIWYKSGVLFLAISNLISFYEVLEHRSWAGTMETAGSMVYRASATLFNPNLYGFCASLLYLAFSYVFSQERERRGLMLAGMMLASCSIYLSGARSAAYLLLVALFILSLLLKGRLRWLPLLVFPLCQLAIFAVALLLDSWNIGQYQGWQSLVFLGGRMLKAGIYLFQYLLQFLTPHFESLKSFAPRFETVLPSEINVSIDGRFVGEGRDSGWFVLGEDGGWLGGLALLLPGCVLLAYGAWRCLIDRSSANAYAVVTFFYCMFIGLVMRFQIFPVWLFIAVALIPCLACWGRAAFQRKG